MLKAVYRLTRYSQGDLIFSRYFKSLIKAKKHASKIHKLLVKKYDCPELEWKYSTKFKTTTNKSITYTDSFDLTWSVLYQIEKCPLWDDLQLAKIKRKKLKDAKVKPKKN